MEATKRLIQDGRWRPIDECADGAEVLTIMKHGVISGTYTKSDGECGGYYWSDLSWYPSKFRPLPDNRLADALEVAVEACRKCKDTANYISANFMDIDGLPIGHIGSIEDIAEESLAKIEQIAKGDE